MSLTVLEDRNYHLANEHADRFLPRNAQNPTLERAKNIRRSLIPFCEIEPVLDANYLVKGWLSSGTFSVLYGPSNVGKTFVVIDLAMHVAAGEPWFGQRVSQGVVLYVAAEGGFGIKNRLAAIARKRPELAETPFYLLPMRLNLGGEIDHSALAQAVSDLKPSLVVVDTLARTMGDGNENSTQDMNRFVASVDRVRELTGAHVLVVHHSGKNEENGARGSTALRAAADTEICVSRVPDCVPAVIEIKATKQRDYENPRPICVSLRSVELGLDLDGDAITSAVVEISEDVAPKRKPLKGEHQEALNAMDAVLEMHGHRYPRSSIYPQGAVIVEISCWRDELVSRGLLAIDEQKKITSGGRTAFQRIKKALVDNNLIRMKDDRVWRCFDE